MQKAIITIVQNGNNFIQVWYRYYRRFFNEKDIYILDFGTSDQSLDGLVANIIPIKDASIERVEEGNKLINEFKSKLLDTYNYILYADYDEIIYYPHGFDALLKLDLPYYTTLGYEIVQKRAEEPPIDWEKTILSQRSYWYRCQQYDKPLITREDFSWAPGNHSASVKKIVEKKEARGISSRREENIVLKPKYQENLLLLHLHKVDFDHALHIHQKNVARLQQATVGGLHNFFTGKQFENWFSSAEKQLVRHPLDPGLF